MDVQLAPYTVLFCAFSLKRKNVFRVVAVRLPWNEVTGLVCWLNDWQINRRLVEKANQVSDMDKTIRQVIRKLQARDADLGLCNAELRRVQTELKVTLHSIVVISVA